MAKVKNLSIRAMSGSTNTNYASWEFQSTTTTTNPAVTVGSWVRIKQGAPAYNGVRLDSWVYGESFKVIELRGTRAVLNECSCGRHRIMTPVHINNLTNTAGGTTTVTSDTVDHYTVKWTYDTGDGIWFEGSQSDVKVTNATYNPPTNALRVRVTVTPVSKQRNVNGQQTSYWTGEPVSVIFSTIDNPPVKPPTPSVKIKKYDLTATVDNISDVRSDEIQFEVYDMLTKFKSGTVTVQACMASYKCKVNAGGQYRVRARATNLLGSGRVYSEWTDFSSPAGTIPSPPSGITKIRATSATSIYVEWAAVNSAETYDIEYANKVTYFDGSDKTSTVTGIQFNHYEKTGLESGEEYFFRVRAVNAQGTSAWSEIKSIVIGKAPEAPTTWSSATTVITGEPLTLYWVHNSEDGSSEEYAEVEITVGSDKQTYTVKNQNIDNEDEKDKTKSYAVDTSRYNEGTKIKWRVRTAGITKTYGPWSIMRTVDVYAPPTLELTVTDKDGGALSVLKTFPFFIKGLAGPKTQMPIGYHISITADQGYETIDNIGRRKIVNANDEVYSRYIDTNEQLLLEMSAQNVDLENNIPYTIKVIVSMNSGLTATSSTNFEVSWVDETYNLDAEIAVDQSTYVGYITPYCRDEQGAPITDVLLSVYRREFDGSYTEIGDGIDPASNTVVTDPHPALDYARYRIIATSKSTGAVSFYDPPGYPVSGKEIVIQWDEEWSDFDLRRDDEMEHPLWTGSILKLPYNVDVSDKNRSDTTLIKYIGRTYPVSYYGTHIDSSSTWNVSVPKSDRETIYALRRLSIWKGDVYVREPSGSGYWASIGVSFSQKHKDPVVPVTLDITRVSGGV